MKQIKANIPPDNVVELHIPSIFKPSAFVVPAIAYFDDLVDIFGLADIGIDGQPKFFERLQRFVVVFGQRLTHLAGGVSEK